MILLIRKKFLLCTALCAAVLLSTVLLCSGVKKGEQVFSAQSLNVQPTVMIDPGHGGEDGGAVAEDGTREAEINLAVSLRLKELFYFSGQQAVLTRQDDISLHSPEANTIKEKKNSDLKNRVKMINEVPNAVLLSIHQNSLPSVRSVHGAQAFYGAEEGSRALAEALQEKLNQTINTEKAKQCKKAEASLYLFKYIDCPAVLLECGFLSNAEETMKLKDSSYQKEMALIIASGFLDHTRDAVARESVNEDTVS